MVITIVLVILMVLLLKIRNSQVCLLTFYETSQSTTLNKIKNLLPHYQIIQNLSRIPKSQIKGTLSLRIVFFRETKETAANAKPTETSDKIKSSKTNVSMVIISGQSTASSLKTAASEES